MPYFIRNNLNETLVFRGDYLQIPGDGAWHSTTDEEIKSGVYLPAVHVGQAELIEAEACPTDVREIHKPKMEPIAAVASAQGMSAEELQTWKAAGSPKPETKQMQETKAPPAPPIKKELPDAVKASLGNLTNGGMDEAQLKAFLEAKKPKPETKLEAKTESEVSVEAVAETLVVEVSEPAEVTSESTAPELVTEPELVDSEPETKQTKPTKKSTKQ